MADKSSGLVSPFQDNLPKASPNEGMPGTYNRNPIESVGQPATVGKGDISTVFFQDIPYSKEALDTPFKDDLGIKNPKSK